MAVDPRWLEQVRAQNRRRLGMGGLGASPGQQVLSTFAPKQQGQVQVIERPEPSKLPTYMLVSAGVVAAIGVLTAAYVWLKEK